ncbi:hypothetical protein PAMA_022011 [Pampus argenteus]
MVSSLGDPTSDELYDDMMPTLENDTPLDETQRLNPAMSPESENCQPEIGLPVLSSTPQKPHLSPGVQKTSSAGQTPCSSVPISPSSGQTSSAGQTSPSSGLGHSRPLPSSPFTQNDFCNTESPLLNRGNCNCNCNCNCENVAARLQQLEHTISSYVPTTVRNMLINITLFIKPVKCSFQAVSKLKSTELDKIIYELKTLQSNVHKHVVVHQQKVLKKKTEFLPANGSFSMGHGELMGYLMGYLCPIVLTNMTRDQVTSADCWAGGKKYRILVGDHKTMSSFGQAAVCLNKTEFQWVKKAAFGHCCLRGEENEYVFHTVLGRNILKPSLPPYGLAERWIDRVSQFQPDPEQCLYAGTWMTGDQRETICRLKEGAGHFIEISLLSVCCVRRQSKPKRSSRSSSRKKPDRLAELTEQMEHLSLCKEDLKHQLEEKEEKHLKLLNDFKGHVEGANPPRKIQGKAKQSATHVFHLLHFMANTPNPNGNLLFLQDISRVRGRGERARTKTKTNKPRPRRSPSLSLSRERRAYPRGSRGGDARDGPARPPSFLSGREGGSEGVGRDAGDSARSALGLSGVGTSTPDR